MITILPIDIISLEDKSYHLLVKVLFPNNIYGNLIIDTGASKSVFDEEFVEPFITEVEEVENDKSSGINAMITEAKLGKIPYFKLNELKITNYKSLLLDLKHVNSLYKQYTNKEIAGLLGSDFLVDYQAIINYNTKTLTLNHNNDS